MNKVAPQTYVGLKEVYPKDEVFVPKLKELADFICKHFDISLEDLKGESRKAPLPDARKWFSHIAEKDYGYKRIYIAYFLGKNRVSVLHMIKKLEGWLQVDKQVKAQAMNLKIQLHNEFSEKTRNPDYEK